MRHHGSVGTRILAVEDDERIRSAVKLALEDEGWIVDEAESGEDAIEMFQQSSPDVVLIDIMLPGIDGFELCRTIRRTSSVPVVMVTARNDTHDVVAGLEAGADEYLTKPVDQVALVARVKSALRMKELTDQVRAQSADLAQWNRTLEERVTQQLSEIERMGRLKRFLSPQVAELVLSSGDDRVLQSHRREVSIVFCDLRGFTGFSESSDPEDVMALLRDYHETIGKIIFKHGGTLERFAGDGVMVMFNDPVPLPNPALAAVQMALELRVAIGALVENWKQLGHDLGFGIGISHGYATLGTIGFEGRFDYAAIGTVTNVASRLCDEAKSGQILVSPRVVLAVANAVTVEPAGELILKGIRRPMAVCNVIDVATAKG
jgi:class 3 adenylate cyclase/CheY-like chemotaxis protein